MPDGSGTPRDLIGFLDYYFVKKAPFQIPPAARESLVRFGPWIVMVLLVLSLPGLLWLLNIGSPLTVGSYRWDYADGALYPYRYWPWVIGLIVPFTLMALALPGLFSRRMSGWRLAFYAEMVGVITGLLAMNIMGALIGAFIVFYVLFQIRPLYK
jgi:hypothetical protein